MAPRRLSCLPVLSLAALLGGAAVLPAPARAFDGDQVMALCLAGFQAAMSTAGKQAPAGMAEFTCTCFLEQVKAGAGLDQARTTCRDRAAGRFTVK
ncbi:MAG: hypothetical protein ACOVNL_06295 [Prochlorococcaceae cyanobacterium]|jgi:hypothetical protein